MEPLGKATLYITTPNFAKQLATMEITNTNSTLEKLKWTTRFSGFFAKTILNVYGLTWLCDVYFNSEASPRKKRPLNLHCCVPKVYKCPTEDKFEIALTRYNGGTKRPVVLYHGAGVSSRMFSLDTIDTNLVEYLLQHRYAYTRCWREIEREREVAKTRVERRAVFSTSCPVLLQLWIHFFSKTTQEDYFSQFSEHKT